MDSNLQSFSFPTTDYFVAQFAEILKRIDGIPMIVVEEAKKNNGVKRKEAERISKLKSNTPISPISPPTNNDDNILAAKEKMIEKMILNQQSTLEEAQKVLHDTRTIFEKDIKKLAEKKTSFKKKRKICLELQKKLDEKNSELEIKEAELEDKIISLAKREELLEQREVLLEEREAKIRETRTSSIKATKPTKLVENKHNFSQTMILDDNDKISLEISD